jgi:predicted DNA-binding protein
MFKRVFSRKAPKSDNVTKSIRITEEMENALQRLAKESGETLNSYIVIVLDQYLQGEVESGNLKPPSPNEKSAS